MEVWVFSMYNQNPLMLLLILCSYGVSSRHSVGLQKSFELFLIILSNYNTCSFLAFDHLQIWSDLHPQPITLNATI